jgi:hypothetical protein
MPSSLGLLAPPGRGSQGNCFRNRGCSGHLAPCWAIGRVVGKEGQGEEGDLRR